MPGQANSYNCPENYSCSNGLKTPCPNGQVSAYGEDTCETIESSTDCPAGFQPNNLISGKCDPCDVGQYSTTGLEGSCADCPAGSYCSTTFEAPILCPAGTYNPNTKQARCIKCPPGSFCSGTGNQAVSGTCTDLDGSATFSNRGATKCEDCPAGKACTVNGLIQDCPLGTFRVWGLEFLFLTKKKKKKKEVNHTLRSSVIELYVNCNALKLSFSGEFELCLDDIGLGLSGILTIGTSFRLFGVELTVEATLLRSSKIKILNKKEHKIRKVTTTVNFTEFSIM